MDRLTTKLYHINKGYYVLKCFETCKGSCFLRDEGISLCGVQVAINKLAAYEDTGLTPEEITEMKADYERRKKLREENEKLFIKEGYEPCPKCGGRNISVVQKRVRKHKNTRYWYYYGLCRSCGHKGGLSNSSRKFPDAWNEHINDERKEKK